MLFVTRYSHNEVMKTAKVAELKAKLTVVVYDRNTPIARLVPIHEETDDLIVIEASAPPSTLKKLKGVSPRKRVDVDRMLRESRGDR